MILDLTGTQLIILLVSIVIGLSLHEAMHGFAAYWLGDDTAHREGRLTLNPLAHIDPFMTIILPIITLLIFKVPFLAAKPVPFSPDKVKYEEFGGAIIAAAGPLTNLVLAFISALILQQTAAGSFIADALSIFISLNVTLFVFNLLPIPPLDGSRILYAFAPESLQGIMRDLEPYGLFIVFGLIFVANLGGLIANISQYVLNFLP